MGLLRWMRRNLWCTHLRAPPEEVVRFHAVRPWARAGEGGRVIPGPALRVGIRGYVCGSCRKVLWAEYVSEKEEA